MVLQRGGIDVSDVGAAVAIEVGGQGRSEDRPRHDQGGRSERAVSQAERLLEARSRHGDNISLSVAVEVADREPGVHRAWGRS